MAVFFIETSLLIWCKVYGINVNGICADVYISIHYILIYSTSTETKSIIFSFLWLGEHAHVFLSSFSTCYGKPERSILLATEKLEVVYANLSADYTTPLLCNPHETQISPNELITISHCCVRHDITVNAIWRFPATCIWIEKYTKCTYT